MKVLLVEPPKAVWDLMGDCVSPPLGLAWIAAVLEGEAGVSVDLIDFNANGWGWTDVQQIIEERKPDVLGATAMTPYFPEVVRMMRLAKELNPEVVTVLGGPHVTFLIEETLTLFPEIDILVRGEGENTIVNLAATLKERGDLYGIRGICFRDGGRDTHDDIVITEDAPPVDLAELPLPAYHLLPMAEYRFEWLGKPYGVMQASRGCPYKCTFCSEWPFWGDWRARPVESILDELEMLGKRYGCQSVWFGDDCFNVDGDLMAAMCEGILRRGIHLNWFYQGRADLVVKYKELLPLMRRSGNRMTQIGIESSGSDELEAFNKNLSLDVVPEAVRLLKDNDIVGQGMLIIGTPDDDARSIRHKLRYAKWLDLDFPIFTLYTPFPGSIAFENAKKRGWLETEPHYHHFDMAHVILPTEHLQRREVGSWYWWCINSYYMDPIKIAKNIFSRRQWNRAVWRHMVSYNIKKRIQHAVRRFR